MTFWHACKEDHAMTANSPPQPVQDDALSRTIDRNISALLRHERVEAKQATLQDRIADRITAFAGSMPFVYLHLLLFGGWIVINLGWVPAIAPWDPSMVVLAMLASVEAIFISTFVLISQNRMTEQAERRAALNLQISLLDEHETTRMMAMTLAIANKLGIETDVDSEVRELQRDVEPEAVLSQIEEEEREHRHEE
jgi:uncharacterized membrane protein